VMIDSLNSEINNIRVKNNFNNQKVVSLMEQMKQKENEVTKLTFLITKLSKQLHPINIIFRTMDSSVNASIICNYSETFSAVEERLYKNYPTLRNANNLFLFNGKSIEKEKSIILNEILDKSVILLIKSS
jgi:hypothetical protein